MALGEDEEPKVAVEEEEQRKSHKQIEESRQRLAKLLFDGTQMVTNIQVAADLRETQRRAEEAELKLQSHPSVWIFNLSLSRTWSASVPVWRMRLGALAPFSVQGQTHGTVVAELKNKDEQYVQAIKKQSDDIHLLLERMEEQIRLLLKTYRHNLLQIEKAFELERQELLDKNRKKWEEGIQAHNTQEVRSV
ncbi:hypothetical protein llap_21939 [Limosa lapponica baueri]|uniref:Uncharacterized protein n=1 Tax=Limosa lapponica baueri TaxID=1758121 RepID=A0A2I0T1T1_LIMLA|nr:hypothetical protein llap_21939 [Limosa lapponica baueri]